MATRQVGGVSLKFRGRQPSWTHELRTLSLDLLSGHACTHRISLLGEFAGTELHLKLPLLCWFKLKRRRGTRGCHEQRLYWGLVCGSPRTRVKPRHGVTSLSNLGEENHVNLGLIGPQACTGYTENEIVLWCQFTSLSLGLNFFPCILERSNAVAQITERQPKCVHVTEPDSVLYVCWQRCHLNVKVSGLVRRLSG